MIKEIYEEFLLRDSKKKEYSGWIYPSSLKYYDLENTYKSIIEQKDIDMKFLKIMHNGTYVHERLQDSLLYRFKTTRWKCKECGYIKNFKKLVNKPEKCEVCSKDNFEYLETKVRSPLLRLSCSIDGIITVDDIDYVIEFKSIDLDKNNEDDICKLPYFSHKRQILLYMNLLDINNGILFYERKSDQEQFEFKIDINSNESKTIINKTIPFLLELKAKMEENNIPLKETPENYLNILYV